MKGVLDNLIDLLQNQDENSIEIRELCYQIVSNLCKGCSKNKKLFRIKGGLDLIITSLKDQNVAKATRYALFTVYFLFLFNSRAILDCLWSAILGDRKNEQIFLDNEGV
jgi:cilia- and flagella-associated protein 69